MERFGINEMQMVADINEINDLLPTGGKYEAFRTVLDNDFNRIPSGWTVVFLRNTPVQTVPDALLTEIKELSIKGFMHDPEDQRFVCLYDANSTEGNGLFRAIMDLTIKWLDANL